MSTIIDGKLFATGLRKHIAEAVTHIKDCFDITPGLAVVLVGEDAASQIYVRNKAKQTLEAGMNSFEYKLPSDTSECALVELIERLNRDSKVNGILVQLPLPKQINEKIIINTIDVTKDVDGFHIENVGRLAIGEDSLLPCTPAGCIMLLKHQMGDLTGSNAVIIGRSNIVGKPVSMLLLRESCTVTMAHSKTRNLPEVCRQADIIVAAVGVPELVKGNWINPGAVVIDVGINRIENSQGESRLVGDVDFDEAMTVARAVTPVPGGVGPMTIACLLRNTVIAACRQNGSPIPEVIR